MHVVILANGRITDSKRARHIAMRADCLICADGGAHYALKWDLVPNALVGDMDSLSQDQVRELSEAGATIQRHPARKEETDLALAIDYALRAGATEITILGALGDRLDHTLANVFMLASPHLARVPIRLVEGHDTLWLVRNSISLQGRPGDTVSLIPISPEVSGIRTGGLEYSLHGESLYLGPSRGISNVLLDECATVTLEHGLLLVIHRDRKADVR